MLHRKTVGRSWGAAKWRQKPRSTLVVESQEKAALFYQVESVKQLRRSAVHTRPGHGTIVDLTVFIAIASLTAREMPSSSNG